MGYKGEKMLAWPAELFGFPDTSAVVVGGRGPNFCGPLILNAGEVSGNSFHVGGVVTEPRRMDEQGYQGYLRENGKTELHRFKVNLTDFNSAMLKLEQLLAARAVWRVLPHNCASFVQEIVSAGRDRAGLISNCPALEKFQ